MKDPEKRLGRKGADEIKQHSWFSEINWKDLSEKKVLFYWRSNLFNDFVPY